MLAASMAALFAKQSQLLYSKHPQSHHAVSLVAEVLEALRLLHTTKTNKRPRLLY